jgi:hypothetical protein
VRQFRPEVPLVIDQLVDRMLARDANDRPATAGDVSRIFSAAVASPAADGQAALPLRADLAADTAAIARQAFAPAVRESPALDVTVPDIFDANPLLSEFNGLPRLQRWLHRHRGGGRLALIVALAGPLGDPVEPPSSGRRAFASRFKVPPGCSGRCCSDTSRAQRRVVVSRRRPAVRGRRESFPEPGAQHAA